MCARWTSSCRAGSREWLTGSGLTRSNYPPGSVCSLHPRCSDEEVDEFLEMNGLVEEADKVVVIKSNLPGGFGCRT